MNFKMTIGFVINSYNRIELLKNAIKAIESWSDLKILPFKIQFIVFDAGSTDGSIEWCCEYHHSNLKMHLVIPEIGKNKSFASGINAGAEYAICNFNDLEYLLFYETDNAILNSASLLSAIKVLELKTKLAACGFTVRKYDGSSAGVGMSFPKVLNFLLGQKVVQFFKLESIPFKWVLINGNINFSYVDVVYTSPLLVKAEAWKMSLGMDALNFPFSDSDVDWAKRLRVNGWLQGVIYTKDVIHDNNLFLSDWSSNRAEEFHRARLRYFKKYNYLSVMLIWPIGLFLRHLTEFLISNFVADTKKRNYYKNKYLRLMTKCFKSYE